MKNQNLCLVAILLASVGLASAQNIGRVNVASEVYGKPVVGSDNQKVGNLNNLIIDLESGRILYATVATSKGRVAVPPEIFTQTPGPKDSTVQANVPAQKINGAPQFTSNNDNASGLGQANFISQVYQYFGVSPWWQGSQPANAGSFHNVHKASETLGMSVINVNNTPIAKVNNVVVDLHDGRVIYVVIAPDSNLGLGNDLYAMPPEALTLSADHKNLVSDIDKTKLASAPHFPKGKWPNVADRSFANQVYQYYGKQAYFNNGLAPTGR